MGNRPRPASCRERSETLPGGKGGGDPASAGERLFEPSGTFTCLNRAIEPASAGEKDREWEVSNLCEETQCSTGLGWDGAARLNGTLRQAAVELRTLRLNQRDCARRNSGETFTLEYTWPRQLSSCQRHPCRGVVPQAIGRLCRELWSAKASRRLGGGQLECEGAAHSGSGGARFGGLQAGARRAGCEGHHPSRVRSARGVCIASAWSGKDVRCGGFACRHRAP